MKEDGRAISIRAKAMENESTRALRRTAKSA